MEINILNPNLELVAIVDIFESLIWTDRYYKCGDFEVYSAVDIDMIKAFQEGYYLQINESEHLMIVEELGIKTDIENGNKLLIKGRSVESILDRRIILYHTVFNGNLQDCIEVMLNDNVIASSNPKRVIPNFIFERSTDPIITALTLDVQYYGENIYDIMEEIAAAYGIGFKVTLNEDKKFVFKLYAGADRSYNQFENPYVVFSPAFDNINNTRYSQSSRDSKTYVMVLGEGEGADRACQITYINENADTGLSRKEMYVDAKGMSSTITGGTLTTEEYNAQLLEKGTAELAKYKPVQSFDGTVEPTRMYIYGVDYFMGDIVQIANEYGQEAPSQVVEYILSESKTGLNAYPTFTSLG